MATVADLEVLVQDRLEEIRDGVGIFWSVKNEIRPLIIEAMNEATLITALPQVRSQVLFDLTANTRLFNLPAPAFILSRMDGPGMIQKTSAWALDQDHHNWEEDTGDAPLAWFPLGIGLFGIYPLLTGDAQVFLTTINLPVPTPRPYTGSEPVPFSVGFQEAVVSSAACVARLKEGGQDFMGGFKFYEKFLSKMVELSKLGDRISSLRFSRAVGIPAQVTDVENR